MIDVTAVSYYLRKEGVRCVYILRVPSSGPWSHGTVADWLVPSCASIGSLSPALSRHWVCDN